MGLFSFLEGESGQEASQPAEEGRRAEAHEGNDLDAFGKGKGKGWWQMQSVRRRRPLCKSMSIGPGS